MKKLISILVTLFALGAYAQENQVAKLENLKESILAKYVIKHEGDNDYAFDGCCADHYIIEQSEFRGDFLKFDFSKKGSSLGPSMYVPDVEAFPATFVNARYEGNQEMIEKYDVIQRFNEDRIVILDEWVYVLEWNSKDDFVIDKVLRPGEFSGVKAVKASFKAKKVMKNADHYNTLKAYLDKAFAKQASLLPKWMEENEDLIKQREENRKKVLAEIRGFNEAFWETEEGKAILRNNQNFENAQKSWVYIENQSGRDIRVLPENGIGTTIRSGSKSHFDCNQNIYYSTGTPDDHHAEDKAGIIYRANSKCNGSVVIQ